MFTKNVTFYALTVFSNLCAAISWIVQSCVGRDDASQTARYDVFTTCRLHVIKVAREKNKNVSYQLAYLSYLILSYLTNRSRVSIRDTKNFGQRRLCSTGDPVKIFLSSSLITMQRWLLFFILCARIEAVQKIDERCVSLPYIGSWHGWR